jgi:hypothetical protein
MDHNGNPYYGGSAKSGQNLYYVNKNAGPGEKKRIKKHEIASDRLKKFFMETDTPEKAFKAALNNRLIGLPLIDEENRGIPKWLNES